VFFNGFEKALLSFVFSVKKTVGYSIKQLALYEILTEK